MKRRAVLSAGAALPFAPLRAGSAQAPGAAAAPWPARPLRMVIPWPPGQSTDHQGRLIAQWLTERLGQPVVPENRPGAGGQIGTTPSPRRRRTGYTLLAASIGPISFQPLVSRTALRRRARADAGGELRHRPFMLLVRPDFPAADLRAFLALLRANPGKYSHNSSGVGGRSTC
jgi:tripartite-type tricarboxylate transporter receptor subunit TctC